MPKDEKDWLYLGDGVYAYYDGLGVWLHTGSHDDPDNRVYLESSVLNSLNIFYNIHVGKEVDDAT